MKYAIRWTMRSRGQTFLANTDTYRRGQQRSVWVSDPSEAILFDSITDVLTAVQERALAINDQNSKLEIVRVQTRGVEVTGPVS